MSVHPLLQRLGAVVAAILFAFFLTASLLHSVRAQEVVPASVGAQADLRINEVMADNKVTLSDPDEPGEAPDWLEIYNPTSQSH